MTSKELFNKNTLLLLIVLQATTAVGDLTICLIEIKLTNILQVQKNVLDKCEGKARYMITRTQSLVRGTIPSFDFS